jgi:hypothetical protein
MARAAEMRRNDEIRSPAALVAVVVIAVFWISAAVSASLVMARYISH